jgi:HEAT repeat protein
MTNHPDRNGIVPIDDEDGFQFQDVDFDSEDEFKRRIAVICVSRGRLCGYESKLMTMLQLEKSENLRRHIVRALGNVGSPLSVPSLMGILRTEKGLILGDTIRALGQLKRTRHAC